MKATSNSDSHLPQNHWKKGVTFDAMEMLERNSDCIDRLTLLVSDLKTTMDRKQPQYKPKIYQGRPQTKTQVDKILCPEIDPLVEEEIKVVIEEIATIGTIIDQIIELHQEADGIAISQVIGVVITQITIDEVIRDQITDKTPNGLLETEVRVGIEMRIMIMTILKVGVEIEVIGEEKNQGPNLTLG